MDDNEQNIPFVKHNVTDDYKEYFRNQLKGDNTFTPIAPFGTHVDNDPYGWDEVDLPIQGPPNWDQIWTDWDSIGADYQMPENAHFIAYLEERNQSKNLKFHNIIKSGEYGVIYRVTYTKPDGRRIKLAAKIIRLFNDPYYPTDFFKEVDLILADMQALIYIKHKNIVRMYDFVGRNDTETGFPYACVALFMELCEGDLISLLDKNPPDYSLPKEYCLKWFREIADAINYLHDKHIVHLDIKPANILYKYVGHRPTGHFDISHVNQMTFKLCDFGASMQFIEEEEPFLINEFRGTAGYVSAEMKDMITGYDWIQTKPCDVYSLGVTLAHTFIGKTHFDIDHLAELIDQAYNHNSGPYYHFDEQMIELIASMIKAAPNTRPTIGDVIEMCKEISQNL